MKMPLITVICTTFNHETFVEEAILSVINQTYTHIELIVVDNASTDNTLQLVDKYCKRYPQIRRIANAWNKGLCSAFNQGLAHANGKYIIDLSGDDVLFPQRIERQVDFFEKLPSTYGVIFSNAQYINETGNFLQNHFNVDSCGNAKGEIPSGDIYKDILEQYFICTPTMMIRREVLEKLGGYDESLTYEDFDFWVRSSILYKYAYQDEILTRKRILKDSLGSQVFMPGSGMLYSTYQVCNKAYDLNRNQADFDALAGRIRTFIRKCFYAQEFELAIKFRRLLNYIEDPDITTDFIVLLCRLRLPINGIYRFYLNYCNRSPAQRKDFKLNFVVTEKYSPDLY